MYTSYSDKLFICDVHDMFFLGLRDHREAQEEAVLQELPSCQVQQVNLSVQPQSSYREYLERSTASELRCIRLSSEAGRLEWMYRQAYRFYKRIRVCVCVCAYIGKKCYFACWRWSRERPFWFDIACRTRGRRDQPEVRSTNAWS